MKKVGVAVLVTGLVFGGSLFADGKADFNASGCSACHNPKKDQLAMGLGPSLKMIAEKYKGDEAGMVAFLKGQGKPRVAPEKFATMQGQIATTKTWPDAKLNDVAKFILSN